MSVTIADLIFDYTRAGSTCYVRFYAESDYVDDEGVQHPAHSVGGQDYLAEISCTVAAGRATKASFSLPATYDVRTGDWATLAAYVFDSNRNKVFMLASGLRVPTPPATTSWANLLVAQPTVARVRDNDTYSKQQVDYRIADADLYGSPATTSALGRVKMSVAPADAASPVAVGDNDPRVQSQTNVAYYAGTGNAAVDTPGLQAAIDSVAVVGGKVKLSGTITVNSTIRLTNRGHSGTETYVSLEGDNPITTKLQWAGATNGILLSVTFNKYFKISGVGLYNTVAKGTTIGMILWGPNTVGTQTLAGIIERVLVMGFNIGIEAGAYTGFATSEILYTSLTLLDNNTGWKNQDLNTLDHTFLMLQMAINGTGLDINSGNANVVGGSASGQTVADFALSNAGTPFSVRDFRSETANRFIQVNTMAADLTLTVSNCLVQAITNADNIAIDSNSNTLLTIEGCAINAKVRIKLFSGASLIMRNNSVIGDALVPFFIDTSAADALGPKYIVENNRSQAAGSAWWPDESGQYVGTTRVPAFSVTKGAALTPPFVSLSRVKVLAQGSDAAGKNLRGQDKFAGSAVKAVTFVRNVTISTTAGTAIIAFASGVITAADVGRKIVLLAVDGSGGNVTGYVKSLDSPLQATLATTGPTGVNVTSGSVTATIGEDEPDANYILSIGCDAQETISWSNKATTGFTLTSSNATSTATVDWILVR